MSVSTRLWVTRHPSAGCSRRGNGNQIARVGPEPTSPLWVWRKAPSPSGILASNNTLSMNIPASPSEQPVCVARRCPHPVEPQPPSHLPPPEHPQLCPFKTHSLATSPHTSYQPPTATCFPSLAIFSPQFPGTRSS